MGTDGQNWHQDFSYDQWIEVPASGKRPAARYKVHFPSMNIVYEPSISLLCAFQCSYTN